MFEEILLGLLQGLTEFLPISSSGHLVVVPAVLGWDEPSLTFDVLLHLGTLAAVVIYFRHELIGLVLGILGRGPDPAAARRMALYLAIGTVPAVVAGLVLGDFFERLFESPYTTCAELVATAFLLLAMERVGDKAQRRQLDTGVATGVGVAQAVAIFPGISRSGATIGAGLVMGLSREEATRFSFLLSIPAIAGAGVLSLADVAGGGLEVTSGVVAGVIVSGVAGYLSIGALLRFVRTHSLAVFAVYLLVMAPLSALIIFLRR
ncbi:MAG: undecaprenyl-diphosphate phosphatase [Acidimicrobiia bacterium]